MQSISISVTALARFVSRTGNLSSSGSFESVSGIEGTMLHKRIFADLRKQYGEDFETEHSFSHIYTHDNGNSTVDLQVRGRADILFPQDQDGLPHIIEIKSFNSGKTQYSKIATRTTRPSLRSMPLYTSSTTLIFRR